MTKPPANICLREKVPSPLFWAAFGRKIYFMEFFILAEGVMWDAIPNLEGRQKTALKLNHV